MVWLPDIEIIVYIYVRCHLFVRQVSVGYQQLAKDRTIYLRTTFDEDDVRVFRKFVIIERKKHLDLKGQRVLFRILIKFCEKFPCMILLWYYHEPMILQISKECGLARTN